MNRAGTLGRIQMAEKKKKNIRLKNNPKAESDDQKYEYLGKNRAYIL